MSLAPTVRGGALAPSHGGVGHVAVAPAHRAAGVAAVKRSHDYILVYGARVPRPRTPDSTDRALAKRAWERGIQEWRKDLKQLVEFHRLLPLP